MKFLCNDTWPWWIFRRGMKGCFTSFWSIMWRNYCQLYTLPLLARLVRNTGAFSDALRVFTSVWKRSRTLRLPFIFMSSLQVLTENWILQGKDSWSVEELAGEKYPSNCCYWWWAYLGARGSWLPGIGAHKFIWKLDVQATPHLSTSGSLLILFMQLLCIC